jgi:glucose/arabinose dehydrogenase
VRVAQTVTGFQRPWEIAFLPDGTPIVTERGGRIAVAVGGTRRVVATISDVVASGEGGLLGLAVDPDFTTNRRIFACYDHGSAATVTDVRIVRFRVAEDLASMTDQTPILTGIDAGTGGRHQGCRLRFGPDRMLWATTGDAAQPTFPQDVTTMAAKVLRMTADGAPAPGNPGDPWNPYVYSVGHRNGQGLAFRADGAPFEVEHGTGCDDEVNRIVAGGNYGWNPVGSGYDESRPMTDLSISGARPAVWSSGCPTIAPSGATFVTGAQWGQWNGALAIAVLKGTRLMFVRFTSPSSDAVTGIDIRLTDQGRLRAVAQAPDGSLWVAQDASPGSLLRLLPAP